jgi:preprotein translocase subunit SecG
MNSLFAFFKSKVFFKNLVAYLAFVLLLFIGLSIFLGSYTRPGQTFDVPDFV